MFQVPQHDIQMDNSADNQLCQPSTSQVCLKKKLKTLLISFKNLFKVQQRELPDKLGGTRKNIKSSDTIKNLEVCDLFI